MRITIDSLAKLADSVLQITEEGGIDEETRDINTIESCDVLDVGQSIDTAFDKLDSDLEKRHDPEQTTVTVVHKPENTDPEKAVDQKHVKRSNNNVYNYYIRSAGRRNFIAFIVALAGLVFGLSFPRELTLTTSNRQ